MQKEELNSVTLLMKVGVASDGSEATGQLAVDILELLSSCRSTSEGRKRETETSNVKGKQNSHKRLKCRSATSAVFSFFASFNCVICLHIRFLVFWIPW